MNGAYSCHSSPINEAGHNQPLVAVKWYLMEIQQTSSIVTSTSTNACLHIQSVHEYWSLQKNNSIQFSLLNVPAEQHNGQLHN